jgi:cystathionine beta-lyase
MGDDMDDEGITRSIRLSSSLHFARLADYRAAGNGQPVLLGQTVEYLDNGYGLQGNPTLHELQDSVSELENGNYTLLFPSGLTALTALGALLRPDDHWILPDSVYAPMRRYADYLNQQYAVKCDYYDPSSITSVEALIKDKTKLIHIETPSSATFDVTNVDEVVKLAKTKGILTAADNTWASGVLYQPLSHDVDISILSLTKYPAGYSDVFMGSLTCKDPGLFKRFSYYHRVLGYTVSPFSAMLVGRGLESLVVRLAIHGANADQLVQAVKGHKKITKVYQAGSNKSHGLSGPNGLFSIELDRNYSDADLEKAFSKLAIFKIGESWGGTRSLVLPFRPEELSMRLSPPQNTIIRFHAGLDKLELQQADITKFLAALS